MEARNLVTDEHFIGKTHKIFTLKAKSTMMYMETWVSSQVYF